MTKTKTRHVCNISYIVLNYCAVIKFKYNICCSASIIPIWQNNYLQFSRAPEYDCSNFSAHLNIMVSIFQTTWIWWLQCSRAPEFDGSNFTEYLNMMVAIFQSTWIWWLQLYRAPEFDGCNVQEQLNMMVAIFQSTWILWLQFSRAPEY